MFEDRSSVEEIVSALPENKGELLVVVGHHLRLEHLLRQRHETVDVLDGLVGLLPQFHLNGGVQLAKPVFTEKIISQRSL